MARDLKNIQHPWLHALPLNLEKQTIYIYICTTKELFLVKSNPGSGKKQKEKRKERNQSEFSLGFSRQVEQKKKLKWQSF